MHPATATNERSSLSHRSVCSAESLESVEAGSVAAQPFFSLLPDAVILHSVLPLFVLESLLSLRLLSRSIRSQAEHTACAWMSRRFPAGLRILARQQRAERLQTTKPEGRKRKRAGDEVDTDAAVVFPNESSSLLSSASTSSSSSLSPTSSSSSVSYSMVDVVWLMQQRAWARSLILSGDAVMGVEYGDSVPRICEGDAISRFPLKSDQWRRYFTPSARTVVPRKRKLRQSVMAVVDVVLSMFGSSQRVREELRRRAEKAQHRHTQRDKEAQATEGLMKPAMEAKASLEEVGLDSEFEIDRSIDCGGSVLVSFACEGVGFLYDWRQEHP